MGYYIKRLCAMSFAAFFSTAKKIARENRKLSVTILLDMMWCSLRYGAGYGDYAHFNFIALKAKQRRTFLTRKSNNKIVRRLNNLQDMRLFSDKVAFNQLFTDFLGREWLDLTTTDAIGLREFLVGKDKIVVKPPTGVSGIGVEVIEITPETSVDDLYNTLRKSGQTLVEEYLVQHDDIMAIYPDCVNTMRVVTMLVADQVHIIRQLMKWGSGGVQVDNFTTEGGHGLVTIIGDDGTICTDAVNKAGKYFTHHPDSNVVFRGTHIPHADKLAPMFEKAARIVPTVRYVAWDIAFAADGPVIIEGNEYPGYHNVQPRLYIDAHVSGVKPQYDNVLKLENKK